MAARKVVAIHQPTFFPWLGYFDKLARSDVFISLDNVQFPKKGGSWINRVQLVVNGEAAWITMPVVRSFHGTRTVMEMQIDNSIPWREKLLRTVQVSYGRAPFFGQVFPLFEDMVKNPADRLMDYNEIAIRAIASAVDLDTSRLVIGSTLGVAGVGTDLLIAMTRAVGGTAYICGSGANGYQENDKFIASGIELIHQNFKHPVYTQCNTSAFIQGLSIVDTLMNCGIDGARRLLQQGNSLC